MLSSYIVDRCGAHGSGVLQQVQDRRRGPQWV